MANKAVTKKTVTKKPVAKKAAAASKLGAKLGTEAIEQAKSAPKQTAPKLAASKPAAPALTKAQEAHLLDRINAVLRRELPLSEMPKAIADAETKREALSEMIGRWYSEDRERQNAIRAKRNAKALAARQAIYFLVSADSALAAVVDLEREFSGETA